MPMIVFHLTAKDPAKPSRDTWLTRDAQKSKAVWDNPDRSDCYYRGVALVDGSELETAFSKTNHIDQDWTKNVGVQAIVPGARSTSVGDIVMKPDASLWFCAPCGWERIK